VPIIQISRIQHRRGRSTELPQLASGELGWVIDEQRLYIGNGTVADGAPAVGNTEILTSGSASFSAALNYVYQGYLGDATLISTGGATDITRTLQERLDDYVSVKAFGAVGDGSTNDTVAIQRAIDELYCDPDRTDARSRRLLFFPAGQYNINGPIYIPPYAQLCGEGIDKTRIYQSGSNTAVAKMQDSLKQNDTNMGNTSATLPININIENITFLNGVNRAGFEIEKATNVRFTNCKFQGTYAEGGEDVSTSKAVTVISTTLYTCSNIIFDSCQFTKFARLVDFDYDVLGVKFINCDFSIAYYGAYLGEDTDGTSNGLIKGPRDIQFVSSRWSKIGQNAIRVDNNGSVRQIISKANWYSQDVANNFLGINAIDEVPVIQFNADECSSVLDYFERTDQRDTNFSDSTAPSNAPDEVEGVGILTRPIKQITLANNTSDTDTGIYLPALNGKSIRIDYKMVRGSTFRVGQLIINAAGEYASHDDTYTESNGDVGVVLTANTSDGDSTGGNETLRVKYTTTNTGTAATMDYQTTIMV